MHNSFRAFGIGLASAALTAGLPTAAPAADTSAQAGFYRLVQYPQAGFDGFHDQTAAARTSIDMEIYELTDSVEQDALVAASARGVAVRVLLDKAFNGGKVNQATFDFLSGHGVAVRWAPSAVIFHIKATTFDRTVSDVSTANLTSRYYATSRDAQIVDANPAQVAAIDATFDNDWNLPATARPEAGTVQAAGLVWSPNTGTGTAEAAMVEAIAAARRSVWFTSEELADPAIIDALADAAKRGVDCEVVMTDNPKWHPAWATITTAGCRVATYANKPDSLYIHEKIVLDDAGTPQASLLLGSQNAGVTSLTRNRELSLRLSAAQAPDVLSAVAATFTADRPGATSWAGAG